MSGLSFPRRLSLHRDQATAHAEPETAAPSPRPVLRQARGFQLEPGVWVCGCAGVGSRRYSLSSSAL